MITPKPINRISCFSWFQATPPKKWKPQRNTDRHPNIPELWLLQQEISETPKDPKTQTQKKINWLTVTSFENLRWLYGCHRLKKKMAKSQDLFSTAHLWDSQTDVSSRKAKKIPKTMIPAMWTQSEPETWFSGDCTQTQKLKLHQKTISTRFLQKSITHFWKPRDYKMGEIELKCSTGKRVRPREFWAEKQRVL